MTVTGTVTGIDLQDRRMTFGDREPLAFDRLVYTAGSRSNSASVAGAAAHAHTLDTPETSRRLAAALTGRPDCRLLVVGGGLTGIQTAAHIARRHPGIHVTLVSSGTIGEELPGAAQAPVDRALRNLGVEVIEKRRVEAVDAESVRWTGGRIAADVVVWTAGFVSSPLAEQAGLAVTGTGQVEVDAALRSVSHSFVFAAGDGAAVPRASSAYGAYAATATGATAGMNAGPDLAGQPVMPLSMGYSLLRARSAAVGQQSGGVYDLQMPVQVVDEFRQALTRVRTGLDHRHLPGGIGIMPHPEHVAQVPGRPSRPVAVGLVDDPDVGDLQQAGLSCLDRVATCRLGHHDHGVGVPGDGYLGLAHADGLDEDDGEAVGEQGTCRGRHRRRQTSRLAAAGQ